MENNMNNYNLLLNEMYKYYNSIHDFIRQSFEEINNHNLLNIDFYKDFVVFSEKQDGFVVYDAITNKFNLSIPCGLEKYNNLVKMPITKNINIKYKYEKQYYTFFSDEERALIIKNYNINFIEFIKTEFLHEYLKKILNIKSTKEYVYSDDYGIYSEKFGFSIKDIIIEIQSRLFSKRYRLFYLPLSIGNDEIIRKIKWILINNNNRNIILNDSLDTLLNRISTYQTTNIIKFEEEQFEKKHNLKKNSFEHDRLSNLLYKSTKQRKAELVDMIKNIKEQFINKSNSSLDNSYGFVNIIAIAIGLILILIMSFIFSFMIFRR